MVFCGQCGSLLSPQDLTCPNCGAVTEPDLSAEDVGTDAPTIASSLPRHAPGTPQSQHPASPPSTPGQQKLVLHGNASAGNEPAGMIPAEVYAPETPIPYSYRNPSALQSGFPSQESPGYQHVSDQYAPAQPAKRRKKGGAVVLLIILLVLFVIVSGTTLVVLRQNGWLGNSGTPTPPTPSPSQQAQALVQQYYDDINKRDYQDAYNLWGRDPQHPPPTYDQFASGYANTQHDDITFGPITPNADGTVTVNLTILATETTSTGTQVSTFQGSYIVGQQDGAWKLLRSSFSKV